MTARRIPRSTIAADDRLLTDLGLKVEELVETRTVRAHRATDFRRYLKAPVGFAEHVLQVTTLWEAQKAHLRAVVTARRVAAFGGNGAGKTFDDAIIALWWVYCHGGQHAHEAAARFLAPHRQASQCLLWRPGNRGSHFPNGFGRGRSCRVLKA